MSRIGLNDPTANRDDRTENVTHYWFRQTYTVLYMPVPTNLSVADIFVGKWQHGPNGQLVAYMIKGEIA